MANTIFLSLRFSLIRILKYKIVSARLRIRSYIYIKVEISKSDSFTENCITFFLKLTNFTHLNTGYFKIRHCPLPIYVSLSGKIHERLMSKLKVLEPYIFRVNVILESFIYI